MQRLSQILISLVLLTVACSAQVPIALIDGQAAGDRFGHSVTAIYDRRVPLPLQHANRLVVGAPFGDVLFQPDVGTVTLYDFSLGAGQEVVRGQWTGSGQPTVSDEFGFAVSGGFDRNGDLITDVVVGSPGFNLGGQANAGRMTIHDGSNTGAFPTATCTAALSGGLRGGEGVSWLGDSSGDGRDDYACGAPFSGYQACAWWSGSEHYQGGVMVVDGATVNTGSLTTVHTWCIPPSVCCHEHAGRTVAAVGDIDGDGLSDIALGARTCHSSVFIYGRTTTAWARKYSLGGAAGMGSSIAYLGMQGTPATPVFAVGAAASGKVFIYSGATITANAPNPIPYDAVLDFSSAFNNSGGGFGWSMANVGDVTGDGVNDLLVGAPNADVPNAPNVQTPWLVQAGQAILFSGSTFQVLGVVMGDRAGDQFGYSVTGLPDFTGDGRPEFAVGAPFADVPGTSGLMVDAGLVRVMTLHATGATHATLSGTGCSPTTASRPVWSLPNGLPYVDSQEFAWGMANGTANQSSIVVVGLAPLPAAWPLPIATSGCSLYPDGVAVFAGQRGGPGQLQGYARYPLAVPAVPSLAGVNLVAQWYVVSPGSNALSGSMTNMLSTTILAARP